MPNVDSSGKTGRSMDYSMYLKRKRHNVLTTGYTLKSEAGNPMFGRDKKTRGFDNGIVTVLFEKGLIVGSGSGSGSVTYTINYTAANDSNITPLFLAAGVSSEAFSYIVAYEIAVGSPGTSINSTTISNFQTLAPVTRTITNNTTQNSVTYTFVGNPATDESTFYNIERPTANNGDSMTDSITIG